MWIDRFVPHVLGALFCGATGLASPSPVDPNGESALPRVALLHLPDPRFSYPNALPMLFERGLDCAEVGFIPTPIPAGASENLARLVVRSSGRSLSAKVSSFLRSEGRAYDWSCLLVLESKQDGEGVVLSLHGSKRPFEFIWEVGTGRLPVDSLSRGISSLVDSVAARFGWKRGKCESFPTYNWEAEEKYAQALATGSLRLLEDVLDIDSTHAPALSRLGFRLAISHYPQKGVELLGEVSLPGLTPVDRTAHEARIVLVRGRREEPGQAETTLPKHLPPHFDGLLLGAMTLLKKGKSDEASRRIREAIATRPLDPLPHRILGDAALAIGSLDLAREAYRRADELGAGDPLARIGLASVFCSEGRVQEATDVLARSPPPYPHRSAAHFLYAAARSTLQLAQGVFSGAVRELIDARDEAYRVGNEEALLDLTVRLCRTYLEEGAVEKAAGEVAELRFRRRSPYFAERHPGLVPFLEGLIGVYREDLGTVAAKKLELETTEGADPAWTGVLEGYYYLHRGSGWEAVPYLRRTVRLHDSLLNRQLLGRAYLKSGELGRARQELERVVERGESLLDSPPVLPLSFFYLGRALEERGEYDLALIAYEEFLNYWNYADSGRPELKAARESVDRIGKRPGRG